MDDLITFLLARYDDTNTDLHTVECGWHQREFGHEGIDCTCGAPERLLAEVDAKQRIIEQIVPWVEKLDQAELRRVRAYVGLAPKLLRLLALPYAGHEEFREEWRS